MKLNRNKALAMLASFLILTAAIGIGVWSLGSPSTTVTITPQSLVDAYSYVVFAEGSTYYLKNGSNSQIEYSSTNVTLVEQYALGNLTVSGGSVFLKGIAHNTSLTFGNNIFLTTELAGIIEYWAGGTMVFHVAYDGVYLPDADIEASAIYMSGNIAFNKYQATAMVFYKGTSFPASPVAGEPFYRTDLNTLYVYDGAAWNNAGTGAIDSAASYSYLIFINGTTTYMKDGTTGKVVYSSANASKVFIFAVGNSTYGGKIFVKAGTYLIDSTIYLNNSVTIEGEMWGITNYGTCLQLTTPNIPMFYIGGTAPAHTWFITLKDMQLLGDDLAGTTGVKIGGDTYTSDVWFQNIFFYKFGGSAVVIQAHTYKVWNIWIRQCLIEENGLYGVYLTDATDVTTRNIDRVSIENCHFYDNLNSLRSDSPCVFDVTFSQNTVEQERQSSINCTYGRSWKIVNNRIMDCGTAATNTYGAIFVNGTSPTGWLGWNPESWLITDNHLQDQFTSNMNYSVWLTGNITDFQVKDNTFVSLSSAYRGDGLTAYSSKVVVESNSVAVANEDVSSYSYLVYTDGTNYFMRNGSTGRIDYSSTNASQAINFALGNLTSGRTWQETVYLKGNFSVDSPLQVRNFTHLILDGKLTASASMKAIITNYDAVSSQYITVEGGILNGNKDFGVVCGGINFTTTADSIFLEIRNLKIEYVETTGIHLQKATRVDVENINLAYVDGRAVEYNVISDSHLGRLTCSYIGLENVYMYYCQTNNGGDWYLGGTSAGDAQFYMGGCYHNELVNVRVDHSATHGIKLDSSGNNTLLNFHIDGAQTAWQVGLWLADSSRNSVGNVKLGQRDGLYQWGWGVSETGTSDYNMIYGSFALDCDTGILTSGANSRVSSSWNGTSWIKDNTETSGSFSNLADGATIAHGLAWTPTTVIVTSGNTTAIICGANTLGATTFTLSLKSVAGAAQTGQTGYWYAIYDP